jgi:hypothetical protein
MRNRKDRRGRRSRRRRRRRRKKKNRAMTKEKEIKKRNLEELTETLNVQKERNI